MSSPFFSPKELACHHCRVMPYGPEALATLDKFRTRFGEAMIVNSGYRCPDHNAAVSKTGRDGPHTIVDDDTICVDVVAYGDYARRLFNCALEAGVPGLGLHQRGPMMSRFIHLDWARLGDNRPRPAIWTY